MKKRKTREIDERQGPRLKQCLDIARINQAELSRRVDITQQHINYLANNKKAFSQDSAQKIANALGVRKEYLLCEDDYRTEKEYQQAVFADFRRDEAAFLTLLYRVGNIKTIETILRTESGNCYAQQEVKLPLPEKDLIGHKGRLPDHTEIPKSIGILVEINGIKKEIPYDLLYYLKKDILEYIEFKCTKFREEFSNL